MRNKAYHLNNNAKSKIYKQKHKEYYKDYNLRRLYGITLKERDSILASQGNVCAICKTDDPKKKGWCVDHNHQTREVRGILCHSCNILLGHSRDSTLVLQNAIDYLTS